MIKLLTFNPLMASHFPRKISRPLHEVCELCLLWLCPALWFLPCHSPPQSHLPVTHDLVVSWAFLSFTHPGAFAEGNASAWNALLLQGLRPVLSIFLPGGTTGHTPSSQYTCPVICCFLVSSCPCYTPMISLVYVLVVFVFVLPVHSAFVGNFKCFSF